MQYNNLIDLAIGSFRTNLEGKSLSNLSIKFTTVIKWNLIYNFGKMQSWITKLNTNNRLLLVISGVLYVLRSSFTFLKTMLNCIRG